MATGYWSGILKERIGRRRALAASGAAALGTALLAACGSDGSDNGKSGRSDVISEVKDTSKQAVRGGVFKWYQPEEPAHFDAQLTHNPGSIVKDHVYSQLVIDKPGYLKSKEFTEFDPILASSFEFSPDLLTLTMKLRQGVKWQNVPPINGRAVEVQDVISSWQRFLQSGAQRASYSNTLSPDAPISSFTAVDSSTLVMKLAFPASYLLSILSATGSGNCAIFTKEAAEGQVNVRNTAIGNGAFYLSKYEPSQSMTFSRNPNHWEKDWPYVDEIFVPFIPEYATGLSQFKAGNIHTFLVKGEDVLPTKQDVPALNIYENPLPVAFNGRGASLGFLPGSPFQDERVRQALSMSYDRDLWLDVFGNVSKFEKDGLPVSTRWFSAMGAGSIWWLDPKDEKAFGPNAKYYKHDVAEAKKLMAAAGLANGLEVASRWPVVFGEQFSEVLDNMAAEVGFKISRTLIDANVEYPKYRDANGQFDGWAYVVSASNGADPISIIIKRYTKGGGAAFMGFDAAGKGDKSGDPQVEDMVKRANLERDVERKKAIIFDIQRHLGKAQYEVVQPGQFSGFEMAWPALRNFNVYDGAQWYPEATTWLDQTQPPFAKA